MTTLTCEHCESEIDVAKDPRCIQQGGMDVMCERCRDLAYQNYGIGPCMHEIYRIERGWLT